MIDIGAFGAENLTITVRKRSVSSVDGARGSLAERTFPRICIWEYDGEASMFYRNGKSFDRDGFGKFRRSPCCLSGEPKKPGQTISKGHKNYDLMLNLQLGIRYLF